MRHQKVLVLGGSGFVGRHLINRLIRDGHGEAPESFGGFCLPVPFADALTAFPAVNEP